MVFHRARDARGRPPVGIQRKGSGFAVTADKAWLDSLPLTAAMLADEVAQWSALGHPLTVTARAGFALTV